ncbi:MAG: hypothetical protein LBT41_05725 [Candidatus Methanoplasma sp.]|jgi:hypothetical protein|nr:hypothetical protein [Candidatus Methanoplasma sp.]
MVMDAEFSYGGECSHEEFQQIRYGMALWMLQENGGLSYAEARVYLADDRFESTNDLSKALGVTKATVYNLASSARAKLEKFEDREKLFRGYWPLVVDVNPRSKRSCPLF